MNSDLCVLWTSPADEDLCVLCYVEQILGACYYRRLVSTCIITSATVRGCGSASTCWQSCSPYCRRYRSVRRRDRSGDVARWVRGRGTADQGTVGQEWGYGRSWTLAGTGYIKEMSDCFDGRTVVCYMTPCRPGSPCVCVCVLVRWRARLTCTGTWRSFHPVCVSVCWSGGGHG